MSHIPNSAMPHAGPDLGNEEEEAERNSLYERAGRAAEKARENPKTSIAAGAAMLVGAIAAAAIPFFRSRKADGKSSATSKKQNGSGEGARKNNAAPKASAAASRNSTSSKNSGTPKSAAASKRSATSKRAPASKAVGASTGTAPKSRAKKSTAGPGRTKTKK